MRARLSAAVLLFVVYAWGATACVESSLVTCGDLLCPTDAVCTPGLECVAADELSSCNGQSDAAACATSRFTDGVCVGGVCREVECGDGRIVSGELCDDGNQRAGDGCSADCLSTEVCGNVIVDGISGEECDNSIAGLSRDGCTSTCQTELPSWHDVTPRAPNVLSSMTYDSTRGRVVGLDSLFDAVWEFDGRAWRRVVPPGMPSRRTSYALTYDAERREVIMFGGQEGSSVLNETWTWDGIVWTRHAPPVSPPARAGATIAYDAARKEVVLFGGSSYAYATKYRDTWVWDGTTWTERTPATSPNFQNTPTGSPVIGAELAYDHSSAQLVLWTDLGRTWLWNGTTWTVTPIGTSPSPRRPGVFVSSPGASGGVVMFGGLETATNTSLTETWVWRGTWTQATTTTQPPWAYVGAYDVRRDRIIAVGGSPQTNWEWNGTAWNTPNHSVMPALRSPGAAYLAPRGLVVAKGDSSETWMWDGLTWDRRILMPSPPAREMPNMVGMNDRVLLFSGGRGAVLDDTWEFNGMTWTLRQPSQRPRGRSAGGLAYDRIRDRVVLFGGNAEEGPLGDTWEWDGTDWRELTPSVRPTPRYDVSMAFDAKRQRVVMVGGRGMNGALFDEVWEWDGSEWSEHTTAGGPSTVGALIAWDPNRAAVVLLVSNGLVGMSETWEWTGTAWRRVPAVVVVPDTNGWGFATLVYDAARAELVMFGDSQGGHNSWALRYSRLLFAADACIDSDTDADGFVGCADPDCWGRCTPQCPPGTSCSPLGPRCGDGTCSDIENRRLCPQDCS